MNKKGFTLVELLAVLVLIALVSMLTFPNLRNLMKNNNEKQFTTYEELMVSYAKSFPINRYVDSEGNGHICLNTLKMKKINDKMECNGYVQISRNTFTPYLVCRQNGEQIWKSKVNEIDTWTLPDDC